MSKPSNAGKKVSTLSFRFENTFEWMPIDDRICVFKRDAHLLCDNKADHEMLMHLLDTKKTSMQGFCTIAHAIEFASGTRSDIPHMTHLLYTEPHFMHTMRTMAFGNAMQTYHDQKKQWYSETPFDTWKSGDRREDDILEIDFSSHVVKDRNNKLLSIAIPCSSTSGSFTDQKYDMEKLISHLEQDPRVRFENPYPHRPVATNHLYTTPYDSSFYHYTAFTLYLDQHTFDQVIEKSKQYNRRKNNHISYDDIQRAMFEMDVLGVHANGIALYSSYHASRSDEFDTLEP